MEIIIGLVVVVVFVLLWQANRKKPESTVEAAPYKVEAPVVEAPAAAPVVEAVPTVTEIAAVAPVVEAVAETAPAKKPRVGKTAANAAKAADAKKKPAAKKAPAKAKAKAPAKKKTA
jgi:hypothetical protein